MGLEQKISELIGRWDGSDATERGAGRDQLIKDLAALAEHQSGGASAAADNPPPQPQKVAA